MKKPSAPILWLTNGLKHKVELKAETQSYFSNVWKNKAKKEILADFDAVMKKVGKKKVPNWDRI